MELNVLTTDHIKEYLPAEEAWILEDIDRGRFFAMGAFDGDKLKGIIVYSIRYPDEGEGKLGVINYLSGDKAAVEALLDAYAGHFYQYDVRRTVAEISDKKVADGMKKYGFDVEKEESIYLFVTLNDLKNHPLIKGITPPESILPLRDASPIEFRYFLMKYSGMPNIRPLYDFEATPMGYYDLDLSCVSLSDEGIDVAFLIFFGSSGTIIIELLAGFGKHFQNKMPYLFAFAVQAALEKCPSDTRVLIRRRTTEIANLTDKVFKGAKGDTVYRCTMEMQGAA